MPSLRHKRGTLAQINAAATASGLKAGEVYYITDENRLTVGSATNAHQPMAKKNEGGADPTDPSTAITIVDDFLSQSVEAGEVGELGWSFTNGSMVAATPEANHPGIVGRRSGVTANTVASFYLGSSTTSASFRHSEWDRMTWIFRATATNLDTNYQVGLMTAFGVLLPTSGVYLERLAADANWFFVSRSAGVQTRVDSGVAFSTGWVKIRLRRIDASSLGFSINDGAEVVITTNIPAAITTYTVGMQMVPTGIIARDVLIDFVSMKLLPVTR
jgi:hypothetical protein